MAEEQNIHVAEKIEDLKRLTASFDKYYERLEPLLEESVDKKEIGKRIKEQRDITRDLEKMHAAMNANLTPNAKDLNAKLNTKPPGAIKQIFEFYSKSEDLTQSFDALIQIISKPQTVENIPNVSQTYKLETLEYLHEIILKYEASKKILIASDHVIRSFLISKIISIFINDLDILSECQAAYHAHINTSKLYTHAVHEIIHKTMQAGIMEKNDSKIFLSRVIDILEEDKKFILNLYAAGDKAKRDRIIVPRKFGLLPATNPVPLDELYIKVLNAKKSKPTKENLSQDLHANILIIRCSGGTPVEYDLQNFVDPRHAQKFSQPDTYGVNEKTVERCKSIKLLEGVGHARDTSAISISYEIIYHNNNSNNNKTSAQTAPWLVLETNNRDYTVLTPWLSTTDSYLTPAYKIKSLIDHAAASLASAAKDNTQANYHAATTELAARHMFLPKTLDIDALEETANEIDTGVIRNDLFMKLTKSLNKKFDAEKIEKEFKKILMDFYKSTLIGDNKMGKAAEREIYLTFLCNLEYAARQFIKMLTEQVNAFITMDDEHVSEIINNCINLVLGKNSDVITSVKYKYLLLSQAQ